MFGAVSSYTCPSDKSICYSLNSPETHATLQDLQMQINRFASKAGFSAVTVDGLIGSGTVSAAGKAMSYAAGKLPDGELKATVIALKPFSASRQLLTPNADGIGDVLRQSAIALGLAPPSTGGGGGGGGYTPTPTLPGGTIPFVPDAPGTGAGIFMALSPNQKALIGVGGAIALGAAVIAGVARYRKRRKAG